MTWGIPTHLFLQIHVAISLIALVAGLIALYGWINNKNWNGWTALFLVTIILTSVTGFPPPAVRSRSAPDGRHPLADSARDSGARGLRLQDLRPLALDLYHRGDRRAVARCLRRRHSGFRQAAAFT